MSNITSTICVRLFKPGEPDKVPWHTNVVQELEKLFGGLGGPYDKPLYSSTHSSAIKQNFFNGKLDVTPTSNKEACLLRFHRL